MSREQKLVVLVAASAFALSCCTASLLQARKGSGEELGMIHNAGLEGMLAQPPCSLTPRVALCLSGKPPAPRLQGNRPAMRGKQTLLPATRPSSQQWRCARGTLWRPARIQPINSGFNCCRSRMSHTAALPCLLLPALPCAAPPCSALPYPWPACSRKHCSIHISVHERVQQLPPKGKGFDAVLAPVCIFVWHC